MSIVYKKIANLLDSAEIKYQLIDHEPVLTCEDAAKIRGTKPEQGAKALVCIADKKPILIVLPCSARLDFKAFKKWQEVKDLRFATAEEVKEITQIEIGAIPPIGLVLGLGRPQGSPLQTFVDKKLLKNEEICFNAGMHERSIVMKAEDYVKVVKPEVGSFTK